MVQGPDSLRRRLGSYHHRGLRGKQASRRTEEDRLPDGQGREVQVGALPAPSTHLATPPSSACACPPFPLLTPLSFPPLPPPPFALLPAPSPPLSHPFSARLLQALTIERCVEGWGIWAYHEHGEGCPHSHELIQSTAEANAHSSMREIPADLLEIAKSMVNTIRPNQARRPRAASSSLSLPPAFERFSSLDNSSSSSASGRKP